MMQVVERSTKPILTGYPSVDQPWLRYYKAESLQKPLPKNTIWGYIHSLNKDCLSDTAFQYFGRAITYGTVFDQIDRATAAFIACGVKAGDCVSLLTSSNPESCYAILALNRIGAIANLLNPTFAPDQIVERIVDTNSRILLALDQLYVHFAKLFSDLPLEKTIVMPVTESMPALTRFVAKMKLKADVHYSDTVITWDDFIALGKAEDRKYNVSYSGDTPAIMVYSSGTTGRPKGIVLGNDGVNATMSHYKTPDFVYTRGDSMLQIIPIWFSTGMVLSFLMPLSLGVTVILEPSYGDDNFVKDVLKYKPNIILAPTSLWLALIGSPKAARINLENMMYPFQGGEKVIERTEDAINAFLQSHGCKCKLLKGYGMCELGSTVTTENPSHKKYISTGYPMIGVTVSAFDPETNEELPYGGRGEIRVLSAAVMKYYYNRPDATDAFFYTDPNGRKWGCTGDIGYVDEDGFVFILGRGTDTFVTRSGRKIYNFDVEDAIMLDKNVFQCEVIGAPDANGNEVLTAFIVLEKNISDSPEKIVASIHKVCCETLDAESVPVRYKLLDQFTVTRSGKRDTDVLREIKGGFLYLSK